MSTRYIISVKLRERSTQLSFCVSSVYGPNDHSLKPLFLQDICNVHDWCSSEPWVLTGDFNMTRFMHERQGCEGNIIDMDLFNNLIPDLGLTDIPLGGRSFTWSNKRVMPAFANLDRFLISDVWDDTFPLSACKALPNTLSDHTPISLHTSSNLRRANRFHFEIMWLKHCDFPEIVAKACLPFLMLMSPPV